MTATPSLNTIHSGLTKTVQVRFKMRYLYYPCVRKVHQGRTGNLPIFSELMGKSLLFPEKMKCFCYKTSETFLTNDMPDIIVKRELPTQRVHGTMDVIQSHILYLEHM